MQLSREEFTEKYGAHPDELKAIAEFAHRHGLAVKSSHPGRRHVVVEGTADQFSKAFGVSFKRYELPPAPRRKGMLVRRTTYRGRDGFIHVPRELSESIVGVFGLDNRPIGGRSNLPGDTPIAYPISVAQAAGLYNFPSPSASIGGQTIGIVSAASGSVGYVQSDLNQSYAAVGQTAPMVSAISPDGITNPAFAMNTTAAAAAGASTLTFGPSVSAGTYTSGTAIYGYMGTLYTLFITSVGTTTITFEAWDPATQTVVAGFVTPIPANTPVYFNVDGETTQDLAIAGLAAIGANLACYFIADTQPGWVDMIGRVLHPDPGDFPAGVNAPSVISSSYFISGGDDPDGLAAYGVTTSLMDAISQSFMDATILANGPTFCVASGDFGSNCGVGGAANQGFNNDICQSDKGRFNVGTPADFMTMGLHKSKDVNSNVLIGRDAMGLYALSSLCTHQCCDMNTTQGNQQVGTISATGIRCNCHISYYDNYGKPINTNQPAKQTLASYGLSLGCDGSIYVDTTKTVAATTRLMA